MTISISVPPELNGTSLRNTVRQLGFPTQQTALLFKSDGVRVDGEFVYPNQPVFTGEVLELSFPGFESKGKKRNNSFPAPEILYEDEAYIIAFKPAGIPTHPGKKVAETCRDSLETRILNAGYDAHPIHRLDAETQGIVVFARFPYAQVALQKQMTSGTFRKLYEAYLFGTLPARAGFIEAPIERKHRGSYTRIVREDGKRALTAYTVMDTRTIDRQTVTHVLLSPLTGRTHQLRVHMHYLGCPILGDIRYRTPLSTAFQEAYCIPTLQLNAFRLSVVHPFLNRKLDIQSRPLSDPLWYSDSPVIPVPGAVPIW